MEAATRTARFGTSLRPAANRRQDFGRSGLVLTSKFLPMNRGRAAAGALAVLCAAGIVLGIGDRGRAAPPALEIRTASLPQASVNLSYSETLKAAGGENPYQWKVAAGKLPKGLTLGTSGALAGTPIDSGTFPITVAVNDTGNPMHTAQKDFSLIVIATNGLQLNTAALPQANLSAPYSSILTASGGVAPYKWSVISGNLPSTLTLAPGGTITGAISRPGTYWVLLEVKDSGNPSQNVQKRFNLVVPGAPSAPYVPPATPAPSASPARSATPRTSPPPTLPNRPAAPRAPYPLAALPGPSASHDGFRILASGFPPGQEGAMYSASVDAEGGIAPYRWSLFSNRLPPGLRLSPAGALTGTPSVAGVYTFTLRATDSSDSPISASQVYQLTINPGGSARAGGAPNGANAASGGAGAPRGPSLQLLGTQLPDGQVNEAYSAAVTVAGGLRPYAFALSSGALPVGLTLDPARGQIQGAPASTGTFSFVVEVSDSSSPGQIVQQSYSIVIAALGAGSQ